ncbi:MAG TPA: FAD-dependent oxidoreductase [Actinomycetes bacterium]|nr:FAD-dependent oxidoreductase [Actinomycetes bacterium]
MLRIAIVGSGPAGVYAAGALSQHGDVLVDVFDRLPCPFGLVRYGVAPDHPKIKSISLTLRKLLEDPAVRFLGNVDVGSELSLDELRRFYDAVIFSSGSAVDRRLGIPGEDLPGSYSATDFVAWYSAHPDAPVDGFTLDVRSVAVIGVGNVAVDVARILARSVDELRPTDLPDHVLAVLERSKVEEIHMIGRRGPAQAKFTTLELRELGELANADVLVDPADLELDPVSQATVASESMVRRNLEVLRDWAHRAPAGRPRRLYVRFLLRPVEVLGPDRVSGLVVEKTRIDESGNAVGTGQTSTIEAQMVLRSVGYRGIPLPGLPFDERSGTVPNTAGRVLANGGPLPGVYVAGWIKRGPTGVIGTNKRDANETVTALLEDVPALPAAPERDPHAVLELLEERGIEVVTWTGWRSIELAEAALGEAQGRDRVKIADRAELLRAAADGHSRRP